MGCLHKRDKILMIKSINILLLKVKGINNKKHYTLMKNPNQKIKIKISKKIQINKLQVMKQNKINKILKKEKK